MSLRITALTDPGHDPYRRRLAWLAADDGGHPVGSAFLRLPTDPGQAHLAELTVNVHPAERRRGVGSALVEAVFAAAREDGRRVVLAPGEPGTEGEGFLTAHGFRRALTLRHARLDLVGAAPVASVALSRPGYRLVSWSGTVPDDLAESFAAARPAMDDMPLGTVDYGTVTWDADRVRAVARTVAERGEHLHTVAVVAEADGAIAGFTELVVPADGLGDGLHYGTAVLPEHRGHGLARWMKVASITHTRERHPRLGGLVTDTAEENAPMLAVNAALGYLPTHESHQYQREL